MLTGMNLIALPIVHTATRRAVQGAHADDRLIPAPRTTRLYAAGLRPRGTS